MTPRSFLTHVCALAASVTFAAPALAGFRPCCILESPSRMRAKYQRWMHEWETRLTTRETNRVVRPLEWGFDWVQRWPLVKDGIFVYWQTTRDLAPLIGHKRSNGCLHADNWSSVPFPRMPNVSLQPSPTEVSLEDLFSGIKRGLFVEGRGSSSIDQQRYNFQFGGQLFYEIKNGKIGAMLEDVAYQSNTQEFCNACVGICDERDWRMGGSFFDGKGQPSQVSAVSHGSATTRFNGINVINTARKIG